MYKQLSKPLFYLLATLVCIFMVAGCGSDNDAKDKKDRDKKSTPGLKLRFAQLYASLDQLERESDIQKKQIASAKAELQAIQQTLANTKLEKLHVEELATTVIAAAPAARGDKIRTKDDEKEEATDNVFRTLVILLFALFAIVYLAKLWRDREYAPATPEDYTRTDAASGSYYSSATSEAGPTDTTNTPPIA